MFPEVDRILHPNNIHLVVRVLVLQMLHNIEFYLGLVSEFLLVSDDFDGHNLLGFVVHALKRLAK